MRNLRVIYDNAVDRATLAATPVVASLGSANLKSDDKFKVCRGTGTRMEITALWPAAETIAGIALPFTNLSPTSTIRVRTTNEPSTTNLIKYSEQADNPLWTKYQATASTNVSGVVAPNGLQTSEKLAETATTGVHNLTQSVSGFLTGQKVTFSIWLKAAERTFAAIGFDSSSTAAPTTALSYVNLSTGALSTSSNGGWSFSVQAPVNGFYRVSATKTMTANGMLLPLVHIATSMSTVSYQGVAGSGIYVWGAQLEFGDKSSYYPSVATSGVRPAGYVDEWQDYSYDSGKVLGCPAPATKLRGWTPQESASAYGYGGGSCARVWLPSRVNVTGVRIDIEDLANVQGYIEVSRLVVGDYWEPEQGVEQGATVTNVDNGKHFRTEAGNLLTESGIRYKKQSLPLARLNIKDRSDFWNILVGNGMTTPMFLSVHPGSSDVALERMHQMYGKLVTTPVMSTPYFDAHSATIEIEEV